jgi:hypothetical protein
MENESVTQLEAVLKAIAETADASRKRAAEQQERARQALERKNRLKDKVATTTRPLFEKMLEHFGRSDLSPELRSLGAPFALDEKNEIEPIWTLEFVHPRDLERDASEQRRAAVIAGILRESLVIVGSQNVDPDEPSYTTHKLFEIHNLEYRTDAVGGSLAEVLRAIAGYSHI